MGEKTPADEVHLGRKRDPHRTRAILDAATALLQEVGYDRIRIQDVADRAGAGLATIYRRWPSKEQLIADAIRASPVEDVPRGKTPDDDLDRFIRHHAEKSRHHGDWFSGLLVAMRSDEELAAAVPESIATHFAAPLRERLAAVFGADHPRLAMAVDVVVALLIYRVVFFDGTPDADGVAARLRAVIDAILGDG